jgi:hypothetical protein
MTANQLIALVALAFGLLGTAGHLLHALGRPTPLLRKLEPMQARWGRGAGTAIHFAAYALAPLVLAVVLWLADA